nr:hypothetical protein [Tanacetum cinerariifolium]
MVVYLSKSNASEGFNQIIDILNGSSIKYALTMNPNIYVSCIKQFWTTVVVKQVNDVTRLQALVDKKKVVVTEAMIREAHYLDDAEGVDCLPNEEIFTELARMGYEKPSTKLTFYKAFFSNQWKFLIHTILQYMSAKRTSWNEFSSSMASAVICLSSGRKFNFSKYIFNSLVRNVDSTTKFYMYSCFLQLIIRKQVGDLSTYTTKYTSPALTQKSDEEEDADENIKEVNAGDAIKRDDSVDHGEVPTIAEEQSIPSPTPPTLPPQPPQDILSTSQGRMIAKMDQDDAVVLEDDNEEDMKEDETEPAEVQEVVNVVTTSKLITEVVTAASEIVTAASAIITTTEAQVPTATTTTLTAALVSVAATPSRRRKGVVIMDPKEESTTSIIILAETKTKDKAIDHVKRKAKEDPAVKRYQLLKRKPQTEAQARKNMMMYLKNVAGFKMDYFKGMSYDDIREDENRALQKINETPVERAAKRRKLDEEVEDLKRHLQIAPNKDDDVYTEATPLARKVPVVDYEIIEMNNKPYYKIIRAYGTHQLYISFLNLFRNFNREDLEALWSLVKERFFTAKPKNFSDDFLLTTLRAMFEMQDVHAQIWKNQRSVHGQLILLVERRYPISRFTLDQMLNVVRLQVKEESEVSLELLRFTRQQHQEGQLE